MTSLFDPITLGAIEIANRVVMAPLTRNRAMEDVPTDLHVDYCLHPSFSSFLFYLFTIHSRVVIRYLDVGMKF